MPVLDIGGWHDGLLRGETEMYRGARAAGAGVETRLYMDPCTHKGCGAPFAPLTNPPGQADMAAVRVRVPRASTCCGRQAPARARRSSSTCRRATQYVSADALAAGRHALRAAAPRRRHACARRARRASRRPRSTSATRRPASAWPSTSTARSPASPYIPTDQRLEGPQGLTFRTAPLDRPLRLAGPIALHLVAASSATDTDWYAKLADVAPDGSESIITEGALRASHRALDPRQEHAPARPYHTAHRPAADRARPLLRLRRRDLADRLRARAGPPAPAAPDLERPADATCPARSSSTATTRRTRTSTCCRRPRTPCAWATATCCCRSRRVARRRRQAAALTAAHARSSSATVRRRSSVVVRGLIVHIRRTTWPSSTVELIAATPPDSISATTPRWRASSSGPVSQPSSRRKLTMASCAGVTIRQPRLAQQRLGLLAEVEAAVDRRADLREAEALDRQPQLQGARAAGELHAAVEEVDLAVVAGDVGEVLAGAARTPAPARPGGARARPRTRTAETATCAGRGPASRRARAPPAARGRAR